MLECHKLEGVKLTMYHLLTIMNVNFPCCLDKNRVCHQRRICKCQCRCDIGLISQNLFELYKAIYLAYKLFLVCSKSSSKIKYNYNFKTMACNFEIKSKSPCHKVYYFYQDHRLQMVHAYPCLTSSLYYKTAIITIVGDYTQG